MRCKVAESGMRNIPLYLLADDQNLPYVRILFYVLAMEQTAVLVQYADLEYFGALVEALFADMQNTGAADA